MTEIVTMHMVNKRYSAINGSVNEVSGILKFLKSFVSLGSVPLSEEKKKDSLAKKNRNRQRHLFTRIDRKLKVLNKKAAR